MTVQPFDFSVDLLRNLLWEYNEAARLEALLTLKQNWYVTNHTEFWGDWQRDVFDLTTANDFGLSVGAVILNVPLVVAADPDPPDKPIFGFGSALAGNDRVNFENGNFAATASG